jgi:4-aminobutyrate aminotransferase-like enzyme
MALKTARLYTGKHTVIAFHGGFHGKTLASLAVTAQNYYREPWQPLLTNAVHAPYAYCYRCPLDGVYPECDLRCARYLEHLLTAPSSGVADVAAVIVEPVQGQGGGIVPPPEFLSRIAELCRRSGALLIADEIITGFGRTGRLFGCEHSGVIPDILVLGKGMASGFPISATVTRREIAACWGPEQHTSTFLGHPVGCAAALAGIQEVIENHLVERSLVLGQTLKAALEELATRHPLVGDVRALGLMATLELVQDRQTKAPAKEAAKALVRETLRRGLMATLRGGAYGNSIRIAPALTITEKQLDFAVRVLDEALAAVEAGDE